MCGFFYYCIIPLVIIKLFPDNVALSFIGNNYSEAILIKYSAYAVIFLILFSIGFFIKFNLKKLNKNKPELSVLLALLLTGVYSILFINIFSLNEVLNASGYLGGYDIERRGQLSTLFLTSIWWYIYLKPGINLKLPKFLFVVIILFSGLNLLTLGSRLAVLTGVIMIFLNYSPNLFVRLKINMPLALICLLSLVAIFGAIGVLREAGELNYDAIFFIIFAEPIFIFASVFSYFESVSISYFNFPYDVLTSIAASVPSFIFTNKIEFFEKYAVIAESSQSGFGGANQIIILLANFGSLLLPFISFTLGYFIAFIINKINNSRFFYTVAISIVSLIPFIFFRDGYQTSLKLALMNFLIIPGVFLLINKLIVSAKNIKYPVNT